MANKAIIIGNSDGIGLGITKALLAKEWEVIGISRSESPVKHSNYHHTLSDVQKEHFSEILDKAVMSLQNVDLCIYCPGIGELIDFNQMETEIETFEVNLMGLVKTISIVIPNMVKNGKGHFLGISSFADELISPEAPSYYATKAGFSSYLESMALALKPKGVSVTNVRFGFVNTKMAKGDVKPFMMTVEKAVSHLLKCIYKKPIRYSAPKIAIPIVKLAKVLLRLKR